MQTAERGWGGFHPAVPPEEVQQVAELYLAEVPYTEIMARTGLTSGQVGHRIRLSGVRRDQDDARFVSAQHQSRSDPDGRPFPRLLRQLREERRWTRNGLAREVGIDPSYLARCEYGEREAPRLQIVLAITRALRLDAAARDQLLVAAGYTPAVLNGSGWPPALHELATVLNDERISAEDREELARTVLAIARRWRPVAR